MGELRLLRHEIAQAMKTKQSKIVVNKEINFKDDSKDLSTAS